MFFKCISTGLLQSNTYIIGDEGECAIIDCGAKSKDILKIIEDNDLIIKYVILTHGHFDHIYSLNELRENTNAKACIHLNDNEMLEDALKNGSKMFPIITPFVCSSADILLEDSQTINLGELQIKVIHTPGHTKGGICLHVNNHLFTGDTLFNQGIGRYDLYGGNYEQLMKSINEKLFTLEPSTKVFPGHGPSTTIADENR